MRFWRVWIFCIAINVVVVSSVPTGSSEEIVLVTEPVAVTFTYPSAVLRFQPWNFQKYSKLDIRFNTREKRGILFFVGSASSTQDCIGVDIFNGNLYVYGILIGKEFRIQMNPKDTSVSHGKFHNIAIQMLPTGHVLMIFDGVPSREAIQTPPILEFDTYTYIGGIDSTHRLPWIAYSQVGFAGCIEYIRVNDDKFIDTNKFAKQTEMQGVKTGTAETSAARCVPGLCDPGKCEERSFNIRDSTKNFFCDCSGSFKTYSSMASDILRGETCIRDSTPFECDRKSFIFFDFEIERITHTDDISLDFKTISMDEPLFFAKRKHGDDLTTFISAELVLGQLLVSMKLQEGNDEKYKKVFIAPTNNLNDGKWHTLKIARYVQEVTVYVDEKSNNIKGELYRSSIGEKFYNKIREIYLGSRTLKPGNDKCSGVFKNFYWNEYDLLNTRNYQGRYQSQVIAERPQLPVLPPFPRRPPHPCSVKPNHQKTVIERVPTSTNSAQFMIEVRTKYDGIVFYAEIPNEVDDWIIVLIVGNSVIVPFHIGPAKGVIEIELTRGGVNIRDNSWHRIILEYSKIKSSVTVFVDDVQELTKEKIFQLPFKEIRELTFSIAGFSEIIQYYKLVSKLQEFSPTIISLFSNVNDLKFVGCIGEFLSNKDGFSKNLLLSDSVYHFPQDSVFCRACQEVTKCPRNHCQNSGQCYNMNENTVACNCSGTNFHGPSCDIKDPKCVPTDCLNGGICTIIGSVKTCNCSGTGYTGMICEVSRCSSYVCQNNGKCVLKNGVPTCDCSGTNFIGVNCEQSQCPKEFCKNNGQCQLDKATGLPLCDCKGTGYTGVRCDKPTCPPNQCSGNGNCVVREDKPFCYCFDDYTGDICDKPVCSKDLCLNNGKCTSLLKKAICTCTIDFEGERCEKPKQCPQSSCFYGGSCTMVTGRPVCNCSQTDYFGSQCEIPKSCPDNYCQNRGQCSVFKNNFVCNCSNTGYSGDMCTNKLGCPESFCLNGGICSNNNGKFECECFQTGFGGDKCDQQSNGMICPYHRPGYTVKMFKPPKLTAGMTTSMGFQTWVSSGTIFCYQTLDDKYWSAKLVDGKIAIDINGMIFLMRTKVNDGKYHVIKVTRDKRMFMTSLDFPAVETLTIPTPITGILSLSDSLIAYTKLIICNSCPDTEAENQFRGAVGGARSGGDNIADQMNSSSVAIIGPVKNSLVPMYPLPRPKLAIPCTPDYCKHRGKCTIQNYAPNCDCGTSGYEGDQCDQKIFIVKAGDPNPGYIVHNVVPAVARNFDMWRFIANFIGPSSPLATFMMSDGNYLEFKYVNGKIHVIGSGVPQGFLNSEYLEPNRTHFFKIQNMLGRLTMYVNKTKTGAVNLPDSFLMPNGSMKVIRVIVGANKNREETMKGFIGGYQFNGKSLFQPNGVFLPTSVRVRTIIVEPWIVTPRRIPKPPSKSMGTHGGMVYIGGKSEFADGYGVGIIVLSGSGPVILGQIISLAGGVLPINAMALGFIAAALLLISAFIWAFCYLGLAGFARSRAMMGRALGNGISGHQASPLLEAHVATTLSNGNGGMTKMLLQEQDFGTISPKLYRLNLNQINIEHLSSTSARRTHLEQGSGEHTFGTYPMLSQANLSRSAAVDMANERIQGAGTANMLSQGNYAQEMTTMNAFSEEEMKVDSCILSADSKYAVTGSVSGPPQVWDLQSGNLIRIMNGGDLTYTSLHLALHSDLLIGLVMENQRQTTVKRLAIWKFLTGEEMVTRELFLSTICCISSDTVNCIIADESKEAAISILNLNTWKSQKIYYNQPTTLSNEGIQFLKISNNSRYLVAGCRTDQDCSCYLIFDLPKGGTKEPKVINIRSLLQSCVFINNLEIVIGTERGEVVVWSLESASATRQLVISVSLEGGQTSSLKPHENKVNCIEVSKDETFMITGGSDTCVRVWDMHSETMAQNITRHEDEVQSVALTGDNEILVTGSWDGSIRTWNLKSGQEMSSFVSSIEIAKVLISNDKTVVVALGERAGVSKLVMLKLVRSISKVVRNYDGEEMSNVGNMSVVSPPL